MTAQRKPKRNKNVAWRVIEQEAILISSEDSMLHSLDEVATLIWEMADGEHTVDQIVDRVCEEYDVEREQAQKDTVEFLEKLAGDDMKLMEFVGE
jgi:hypothetical protein